MLAKAADVAAPPDMGISVSAKVLTKLKRELASSAVSSYMWVCAKKAASLQQRCPQEVLEPSQTCAQLLVAAQGRIKLCSDF